MIKRKNTVFLRTAPLFVVSMLISACGTAPSYVAPSGAATAKLLFKADALQSFAYSLSIYDDAVNCTGPRVVAAGQGSNSNLTTSIKTGALLTTRFIGGGNGKVCQVIESFQPVSGHIYQLQGKLDEQGCSVIVYDISNPNAPQIEQSLLRRQPKNQMCEPLSSAKRVTAVVNKPSLDDFKDLLPGK
ncbi:hypothetical protein ACO0LM_15015 [Undibacterium sp. Di26W]|uniref:hypothetical protein n=1 Tax=Undibacterium sp. Di26W TaxID=3413035 RepID=UPI003BF3DFB0